MKRVTPALLFLAVTVQVFGWQAARQAAPAQPATSPRAAIDDAAAQVMLLDQGHARLMDAATKMSSSSFALYNKVFALCGVRNKITDADAAKAATELCTQAQQWQEQAATLKTQIENENRQYTSVTNVLKTKHDTVKNSISNVR
jgi:hypothetical protein